MSRERTTGKYVLPRDHARERARRQVRVPPVFHPSANGMRDQSTPGGVVWALVALVLRLLGARV
jgi:hypothetical protein